jgi:hypothetical protein
MDENDNNRDNRDQADPPRDAELADVLLRAEQWAERSLDVDALTAAIVARARPRLARLESGGEWWEWTGRWAAAAIPIAIAAGIAAAYLVPRVADPTLEDAAPVVATTRAVPAASVAFAALASPVRSGAPLVDALMGPATHEWLFTEAVSR